ncbi:MAG: large conductance mechanosensitive channel protein MscL [Tepidisphaera sp.]
MGFISEFRDFAMKGNVVDLAVGVIIGGAFGKIVDSMINDIMMPVVGKVVGNVDFSNLYIPLSDKVSTELAAKGSLGLADAKKLGAVLAYGNFITILINFIILAFCIFLVVKAMNEARKRIERQKEAAPAPPPPPPAPPASEVYLKEIRDLLAKR